MSDYTRGLLERFCAIADIQEDRLKEGDYVVATVTERQTGRVITIDRAVNLPLDRWQRDIELFHWIGRVLSCYRDHMIAPLRRVVWKGYFPLCSNGVWALALYEMLECGHWQLKKSSILGPYKAVRRRCNACALLKKG